MKSARSSASTETMSRAADPGLTGSAASMRTNVADRERTTESALTVSTLVAATDEDREEEYNVMRPLMKTRTADKATMIKTSDFLRQLLTIFSFAMTHNLEPRIVLIIRPSHLTTVDQ